MGDRKLADWDPKDAEELTSILCKETFGNLEEFLALYKANKNDVVNIAIHEGGRKIIVSINDEPVGMLQQLCLSASSSFREDDNHRELVDFFGFKFKLDVGGDNDK